MLKRFFAYCLLTLLFTATYANYRVTVVDAGSSGTRLHVYEVSDHAITDVMPSFKIKGGISNFVGASGISIDKAGVDTSIQSLIAQAKKTLPYVTDYPIYVYATAGMRLVNQSAQTAMMDEIKKVLDDAGFQQASAQVISGEDEALYDWISVNADYLLSADPKAHSVGALDLGGASLEVAYETTDSNHARTFIWHNRTYLIDAKSYLGLGLDQSVEAMNTSFQNNRNVCYPLGVWSNEINSMPQPFDYAACTMNNLTYLHHYLIEKVKSNEMLFKAFSGFYYVDAMFQNAPVSNLSQTIHTRCEDSWDHFVLADNHQTASQYLQVACHEGVYIESLLQEGLQIPAENISFDASLDWTKGVALFEAARQVESPSI